MARPEAAAPLLAVLALSLCVALASGQSLLDPVTNFLGLQYGLNTSPDTCSDIIQAVCTGFNIAQNCKLLCILGGCAGGECMKRTDGKTGAICTCTLPPPAPGSS